MKADAAVPNGPRVSWYVAHTKPSQERAEKLARRGCGVYLPQLKVLKGNSQQVGFQAMFPRHFFQPRHAEHSIGPVRFTKGVIPVVGLGVLRTDTLQSIRTLESRDNAVDWRSQASCGRARL
jgi:hypothetical protein